MEQDAPTLFDLITRAHTALGPFNTFTDTSPWHQSWEEYDYVGIMTALDDVPCELRHHNDVDAERDQLMRYI